MVRVARSVWRVGAYYQLNAYSIRLTDSLALDQIQEPNLPENDDWIRRVAAKAKFVVVGWGNAGLVRGPAIERILLEACGPEKVFCYKRNSNGSPVYPLYQKDTSPLVPYFRNEH